MLQIRAQSSSLAVLESAAIWQSSFRIEENFAEVAAKVFRTKAPEEVDVVDAFAAVEARVGEAVVDVDLAQVAREAGEAITGETCDAVYARAVVAIDAGAVVNVHFAEFAVKAGRAETHTVFACCAVFANDAVARIWRDNFVFN